MPLSSSPLLPGMSPLPPAGQHPPNRRALRLGGLLAIPLLITSLGLGQLLLPHILFLAPSLQSQAGSNGDGGGANAGDSFQGFLFSWTRRQSGGGYKTPASLANLQFESNTFHMNSVVIPVVADMPNVGQSTISWHANDSGNRDTLPDSDYEAAIHDARAAGLVPIIELVVQPQRNGQDVSALGIGSFWSELRAEQGINGSRTIGSLEESWFDNYTAFATHFAQMSEQAHLPYLIIGSGLVSLTYDGGPTTRANDPGGIKIPAGESYTCGGRRECEWRHVIHALRSGSYTDYGGHTQSGGNFNGKLMYSADTTTASDGTAEYSQIAWWDAVDYIGINVHIPIMQNQADVDVNTLEQGWHGIGDGLAGYGDIYGKFEKLATTFHRQMVFTGVGYASAAGAISADGIGSSPVPDGTEQLNDMQALLHTFSSAAWWAGVFWNGDEPLTPRESQPNWTTSSSWAGNTLSSSKPAGQWLATYYSNSPLACSC